MANAATCPAQLYSLAASSGVGAWHIEQHACHELNEWALDVKEAWYVQQPAPARACRFYAGEMVMSMLALTAALYGIAAAHKWSFSVFLGLQGKLPFQAS